MSDRQQNIIELAELVGLQWEPDYQGVGGWLDVTGKVPIYYYWNPYESHDDCHAVIEKIHAENWWVIINLKANGSAHVMISKGITDPQHDWNGDDYREGVCNLALKIKREKNKL